MRGGKREGAGRKASEETVRLRVPIGVLNEVKTLIDGYKNEVLKKPPKIISDTNNTIMIIDPKIKKVPNESEITKDKKGKHLITGQKSKEPIKPIFPILTKEQINRFKTYLINNYFVNNKVQARMATKTPKICLDTFSKTKNGVYGRSKIEDIREIYTKFNQL